MLFIGLQWREELCAVLTKDERKIREIKKKKEEREWVDRERGKISFVFFSYFSILNTTHTHTHVIIMAFRPTFICD